MKFCPKCGTQNDDNNIHCVNCGEQLAVMQAIFPQAVYQQPYRCPPVPGKGLGIASMVLGILSILFWGSILLPIPCAIVGIILGTISLKKAKQVGTTNGMAVAGIVCSIVTVSIILVILCICVIAAVTYQ